LEVLTKLSSVSACDSTVAWRAKKIHDIPLVGAFGMVKTETLFREKYKSSRYIQTFMCLRTTWTFGGNFLWGRDCLNCINWGSSILDILHSELASNTLIIIFHRRE
jgi:hypothetical protein